AWLKVQKGDTRGRAFPLDRECTVLGRDASCEIVLADSEVSKRHAQLIRKDDGFHIEDLQSTNGTRIGDRSLTEIRRLEPGDLIEIGSTLLVFETDPTILGEVDTSSQSDAQIVRVRPEEKLQAILEVARALDGTIDSDRVLEKVLETLFHILPQAERGFILLKKEPTGDLILRASRFREQEGVSPIFSRTIFDHVTNEGRALLC